jgi:NAD(P)-dependent dehydrogenase (short-subunit alcohol dehydrogenase family)
MTDSRPAALIVGCGDIAIASAKLIGKRQPLLLTDINAERLQTAQAALRAEGYEVDSYQFDVADQSSVKELADYVRGGHPINGIAHVAALSAVAGDWRRIMDVDLIGPHLVAREIGPLVEPGGAVIFVGSVAGHIRSITSEVREILATPLAPDFWSKLEAALPEPLSPSFSYGYSKAALMTFAERMAVEWGKRNVRSLTISPGLVLSAMGARERANQPASKDLAGQTPLRREATLDEIAAVIDFALSPAASFLNGVDILVDGGLRAAFRQSGRLPQVG